MLAFQGNHFLAICFLSLAVSLLLLPMQRLIDRIFAKSISQKNLISHLINEISDVYSGQARHYYLKTLYRQHGISTFVDLIPVLKIAIQIPFFVIMYRIMNTHPSFVGQETFLLKDLSQPDGLIPFAGVGLNLLPITMFLFNLLSTWLYCEKNPKEKITLNVTNFLFLFLLYSMPSGLVLYWTVNNAISLVGHVIQRKSLSLPDLPKFNFFKSIIHPYIFNILFLHAFFVSNNLRDINSFSYQYSYWLRFVFLACSMILIISARRDMKTVLSAAILLMLNGFFAHNILLFIITQIFILYGVIKTSKAEDNSNDSLLLNLIFTAGCTVPLHIYIGANYEFIPDLKTFLELALILGLGPLVLVTLITVLNHKFKLSLSTHLLAALIFSILATPIYIDLLRTQSEVSYLYQLLMLVILMVLFNLVRKYFYLAGSFVAIIIFATATVKLYAPVKSIFSSEKKVKQEFQALEESHKPFKSMMEKLTAQKKPDIYLLIYDAYPGPKLMNFYGIDNDHQYKYLENEGFTLYGDRLSHQR